MKPNNNLLKILGCIFVLVGIIQLETQAQYTFGSNIDDCPTNLIIATCSGNETFSDTYSNNPNGVSGEGVQICSSDGSAVTVTFTANTVEAFADNVVIFDGTNQYNFPILGFGDATGFSDGQPTIGATYTSTNGCIYVMMSADATVNGMIAFDIDCTGAGAGLGLFTEPVGPGTLGDGISSVNDDCMNAYTLNNTYNMPVTLVANNYDATSGPGDNTCDPDPSDVSGQLTLETTVYFEYCTDSNPGLYQGHGILNVGNCLRSASGGLGETSLLTGTCGNFTPVSYNIGDQLPANMCFTFMVDGLNGDECQFQPFFDESPPPTCEPIFTGDADSYWLEAPDCGYFGTWSAGIDWGTFFTTNPCVSCDILGNCSVNIETDFQLVFVPTTDGVITPFDVCAGEGTDMTNNDFDNLPAHSGGCDIEWYTIKYRVTGTSPDGDCVCDGYCFESPSANFPVFPDYFGNAFADITIIPGVCDTDGTYDPTEIEVVTGSACDGSVTVANSIIQPDPGCGNPTGEDLLVVELAITPADFPASCGAALAGTFSLSSITCECPAECGANFDFVVDDFCSGDAAFFDLEPGCTAEVNPATGQPYVDFDWYIYAPGGVPGLAPTAYDPLPATDDNFPINNADLVLDGSETACSDVAGGNTIINNTCDPIVVTYYMLPWDRQFDSDGDLSFGEYFVGAGACTPLRYDVTIYPEAFVAVESAGNCGAAMVEIQSVDGSVCPPQNGEATSGGTTVDMGCGVTDNQTFNYTFDYFTGTPCTQNIAGSINSACFGTCPPPAAECASYEPVSNPMLACAGQEFIISIPVDACPGTYMFDLDFEWTQFFDEGNDMTWTVTDGSGNTVDSGGPYAGSTGDMDSNIGPFSSLDGPYTFNISNPSGGGVNMTITDQVTGTNFPFTFGSGINLPLNFLIADPFFDLVVNWVDNDGSTITQTVDCSSNLSNAFNLTTTNVCEPEMQQVSYEIYCIDGNNNLIAAEILEVLVYPTPPTDEAPLVDISYDSDCNATIDYLNDCTNSTVTVIENTGATCGIDGTANYTVSYTVGQNAPDCCSTAGPPTNFVDIRDLTGPGIADAFGGLNNAGELILTPTGMGAGMATALTLNLTVDNIDISNAATNCTNAGATDLWISIFVDGILEYDQLQNSGWTGTGVTLNLTDLTNDGLAAFTESSDVQILVYPVCLNGPDFDPTGCVDLNVCWSADLSASISITYEKMIGTPLDCDFDVDIPYTCSQTCPTVSVVDANANVCDGELNTEISDWQTMVITANPASDPDGTFTETLYTTTDLGATTTTTPDGTTPIGTFAGPCGSEDQFLYAYIGCDDDCDGNTDSYIKAGTLTLTVYAPPQAPLEIVRDDAVCNYSVTFACTGEMEGSFTVVDGSSEVPGYAEATVDIEVVNAGGCVDTFQLTKPACPTCPSVIASAEGIQIFCEGSEAPDLTDAATGFVPGAGDLNASLMWYLDQTTDMSTTAPTMPYTGVGDLNAPPDACTPGITTLYAYYLCDINEDGSTFVYQEAGSIDIEIYPTPPALVEANDPACALAVAPSACAAIVMEYSMNGGLSWTSMAFAPPPTPLTGDQAIFRVYLPNSPLDANGDPLCVSTLTVTAENCIPACPIITPVTDDTGTTCDGEGTDDLAAWMTAVAAANSMGLVYSSVTPVAGITLPDNVMPDGIHSSPTSCGVGENQAVMAYVYCDVDGDMTINAGDTYDLVSTYTLTVFPPAQAPTVTLVEACDDGTVGTCTYQVNFACAADTENGTTVDGSTEVDGYAGGNVTVDIITSNGCTNSFSLPRVACLCTVDPSFTCAGNTSIPKCSGVVPLNPVTTGGIWSGTGAVYVNANNEFDPSNAPVGVSLTLMYTVFDALNNPQESSLCTIEVTNDCAADGGRFDEDE